MENLNNSFPCYFNAEKFYNQMDVELEEKSIFNTNFLKIYENGARNKSNQILLRENNFHSNNHMNSTFTNYNHNQLYNFSPPLKKNSLDISYSIEQTFCENSHINIEEELQNEETFLKIGNEGQNPCIDPIQEVDSFELENNESFLHENNYLFNNFNEQNVSNSEINLSLPSDIKIKIDNTMEESDLWKIRKNIMNIKLSKSSTNNVLNKSDINILGSVKQSRKNIFLVSSTNNLTQTNSSTGVNNKLNNSCNLSIIIGNNTNSNNNNLTSSSPKKRGRRKFLFDGMKTEILDKAFLREFKCYLKQQKQLFRTTFNELNLEGKIFWNEFWQNNNPPFLFTVENTKKIEFKSYSKTYLQFVFSQPSVKKLYSTFVKDKGPEIVNSIVNKKIKKIERKMLSFYSFYGKNLHKLYSNEFNFSDFNLDDLEYMTNYTGGFSSTSDSLTIKSTI